MAIIKDITDAKGLKTRYHRIAKFAVDGEHITVTIHSYIGKKYREAELAAKVAAADLERLRNERANTEARLADMMDSHKKTQAKIAEIIEADDTSRVRELERSQKIMDTQVAEIAKVTDKINDIAKKEERITAAADDFFVTETTCEIPAMEPVGRAEIYAALTAEGAEFAGGIVD